MKTQKLKNYTTYKVINNLDNIEFYLNFKPNTQELKEICINEFSWSEKEFNSVYNQGEIMVEEIDILEKYENNRNTPKG